MLTSPHFIRLTLMPEIPLMDYVGNPLLTCLFLALLWPPKVAISVTTATF